MIRYALAALALAVLALGGLYTWERGKVADLRETNRLLDAEVQAARARQKLLEASRREADARAARAAQQAQEARSVAEALRKDMEDADRPVDPRIGAALRCLRAGKTDCLPDAGAGRPDTGPGRATPD